MTFHLCLPKRKLCRTVVAAVVLIFVYNIYIFIPGKLFFYEDDTLKRGILPNVMSSNINIIKGNEKFPSDVEKDTSLKNMTEFWEMAGNLLGKNELYPDDFNVNVVIDKMATSKIEMVRTAKSGTSFKWLLRLDGGQYAIFKPQLVKPGEKKPFCNGGHEQPRYEIAAFHLMRLFGWRTVPFVAGRKVNITSEVLPVASKELQSRINTYNNGTVCVEEKCIHCLKKQVDCFQDGVTDGSLMFWLHQPIRYFHGTINQYHPFHIFSGNETVRHFGLNDHRHCDFVRTTKHYKDPHYFLDMVDISIMDFVFAHHDQKHIVITEGSKPVMTVHIDHGLAFCDEDPPKIMLAALSQCCRVRESTIVMLKKRLPTLKEDFNRATLGDQLYPILTDSQLDNVIDRIDDVLKTASQCETVVDQSELYDRTN